jgi:ABC-type nitrate/sulfonate/bicarbonate transport system ATPase subunit
MRPNVLHYVDAVIRTIRFEPKMDVRNIWQRKNRITVMLIHHYDNCMMLSSKKRVFAIILAPTVHTLVAFASFRG